MSNLDQLNEILDSMKVDAEKFYEKGQNAAGTRLRKSLNDLRKKAAEIRKEIQDERAKRKEEGK
ncbi:MAG TPA: histone H1 [Ignavibacteria bacterium]|nr:histone H1 [Ignavibacteria bacterium]HMR40167.1 histone H1 [Ignavibacteria bacterium]